MHEFAAQKLKPGQVFSRKDAVRWFADHYPDIKSNTVGLHVARISVIRRGCAIGSGHLFGVHQGLRAHSHHQSHRKHLCDRAPQDHQDQGLPQPHDGAHHGLQAVPLGQQEVAPPGRLAPDRRHHSRRQIQGRRKANRTRRLKPASPTFDNSSFVIPVQRQVDVFASFDFELLEAIRHPMPKLLIVASKSSSAIGLHGRLPSKHLPIFRLRQSRPSYPEAGP